MGDKRRHERFPLAVEVELTSPALGTLIVNSRDVSDGGIFLRLPREQCPTIGSLVRLRVNQQLGGEDPPVLTARVVRITGDGIGLAFVTPDQPPSP